MATTVTYDLKTLLNKCWEMSRTGHSHEGLVEAQRLLPLARHSGDKGLLAYALSCIGWLSLQLGQPGQGLDVIPQACAIYAELGDNRGVGLSRSVYSWLVIEVGLSDLAYEQSAIAVEAAEQTDDMALRAFAMSCKGMALLVCRQDQLAFPVIEQALEMARAAGDQCVVALNLINMAYSLNSQAELADAENSPLEARTFQERGAAVNDLAIETAQSCGDLWNLRVALCNGAEAYLRLNRDDVAKAYLDQCAALAGKRGLREEIHYLCTLGEMLTKQGRLAEALEICRHAVAVASSSGHMDNRAQTLLRLSDVEKSTGDHKAALEHYMAYHEVFVAQMGELTRRRALLAEMQMQNERLRAEAKRLESEALRDPLTGLLNRRAFDAAFKALEGKLFSLSILDLDHFKLINDRYSHLVGDAVLTRTGAMLQAWHPEMQAYRLGGEEFALVMPEMSSTRARRVLDALREAFSRAHWSDLGPGLRVTASLGLADSGEIGHNQVMEEADRRLYVAKAAGRNRLIGPNEAAAQRRSRA